MCPHVRDPGNGGDFNKGRNQNHSPSFRCGVHRRDYTVAATAKHTILNTHDCFETHSTAINMVPASFFVCLKLDFKRRGIHRKHIRIFQVVRATAQWIGNEMILRRSKNKQVVPGCCCFGLFFY